MNEHYENENPAPERILIAVDGPAASGKGTIARALARHFKRPHMDTGMLYRAVALNLWRWGGDMGNEFEALRACDVAAVDPADPELRSEAVSTIASRISAYPSVRAALLDRQRQFAGQPGGAVLDGRDIGTVIAPDAKVKLFVTADLPVRTERRLRELRGRGETISFEELQAQIAERDRRDMTRADSPLRQAADAHLLDTTHLSIEAAVEAACRIVDAALGRPAQG